MDIGMPSLPLMIFWSGDECFFISDVPQKDREGNDVKKVWIMPTEKVIQKYGIKENEMDFTISSNGSITRTYPSSHFVWLSKDPTCAVLLMTCNFDGTETLNHDIAEKNAEIARLKKTINNLASENKELMKELKSKVEQIKSIGDIP